MNNFPIWVDESVKNVGPGSPGTLWP